MSDTRRVFWTKHRYQTADKALCILLSSYINDNQIADEEAAWADSLARKGETRLGTLLRLAGIPNSNQRLEARENRHSLECGVYNAIESMPHILHLIMRGGV